MRRIFWMAALLALTGYAAAQDKRIAITSFEWCPNCLTARLNPVSDNTGTPCALIRFMVPDTTMEIKPYNGFVKRETQTGRILLYVPVDSKRLNLWANGVKPLLGYELPGKLEPLKTYDAVVEFKEVESPPPPPPPTSGLRPYVGVGWNVMPLNGPELNIGVDINRHLIELGAIYGLKTTEGLYYYSANAADERPIAGWYYRSIKGSLSYGYDLFPKKFGSVVPMAGVTGSMYMGSELAGVSGGTEDYKNGSSLSAFVALRLTLNLDKGKHFRLFVTPRYDISLYMSEHCKLINDYEPMINDWRRGFNLSAGLAWVFGKKNSSN